MYNNKVVVYTSGTFDMFHSNHLKMIEYARGLGDTLIVGVSTDELCLKYKHKLPVIPFEERKEIVASCRYVDKVVDAEEEDSDAWERLHYDRLFVGSDYQGSERFRRYEQFFRDKGVEIVFFPYTITTSSTQIREAITQRINAEASLLCNGEKIIQKS